jgi:hypothetical protein
VASESSVVSGLARGTAYKGAALPRVLAFLLFVLDILSGNRRIKLSLCTALTLYQKLSFSSLVELERKRSQELCNTSETRKTSYGKSGYVNRNL